MLGFIAIVGVVILAFKVSNLSAQIKRLQQGATNVAPLSSSTVQQAPVTAASVSAVEYTPPVSVVPQNLSSEPDVLEVFFNWFKENWLLKLGVLLILVGFGWFISYAFVHDWIGPIGRVVLGFVVGSVLALFGTIRMDKNSTQGKLFLILGSALVVITSYGGQAVYGLFEPVVALGIVFLVSAYVSTIALQFKMKNIAVYGLVIAYLAPILTDSVVDIKLLFSYLIVVSFASIWLASIKGWREINALALFGFGLFALPYAFGLTTLTAHEEYFVLASIFGLGFVYFLVSILGAIKNQESAEQSDIFVAIFDSALIILATITFVPEEIQSLVMAAWMIVFAVGSFFAFTYTKKEKFFYVYSLISILLLAIATAVELDGSALIYAYAIESAIISIAGYIITRKIDVGYNLSVLMAGPIIMSIPSISAYRWSQGVFHDDFGILFTVGALLFGLGLFYYYSEQEMKNYDDNSTNHFYAALCVIGSIYFLALIWLSSGAIFANEGTAVLVSLVIYTVLGIIMYFYGLIENKSTFKYYGGTLLILVVARLVIVDVWNMELAEKIVTFISIGLLFISTAFIGKKVKEELPESTTTN
jgi:uncharacterized membrane protein